VRATSYPLNQPRFSQLWVSAEKNGRFYAMAYIEQKASKRECYVPRTRPSKGRSCLVFFFPHQKASD
jgi:hypothetical protein